VTADAPGFSPDDIAVEMNEGTLTISGNRKEEKTEERDGKVRGEEGVVLRLSCVMSPQCGEDVRSVQPVLVAPCIACSMHIPRLGCWQEGQAHRRVTAPLLHCQALALQSAYGCQSSWQCTEAICGIVNSCSTAS